MTKRASKDSSRGFSIVLAWSGWRVLLQDLMGVTTMQSLTELPRLHLWSRLTDGIGFCSRSSASVLPPRSIWWSEILICMSTHITTPRLCCQVRLEETSLSYRPFDAGPVVGNRSRREAEKKNRAFKKLGGGTTLCRDPHYQHRVWNSSG